MIELNVTKTAPNAKLPAFATSGSAGADLYAAIENPTRIMPRETKMISTGISIEIPEGFVGLVFARSGLACKQGLGLANGVGVIDSDYRGEVMVALYNHSMEPVDVLPNERIAQMVVSPFIPWNPMEVDELESTKRGTGGFGSTGK